MWCLLRVLFSLRWHPAYMNLLFLVALPFDVGCGIICRLPSVTSEFPGVNQEIDRDAYLRNVKTIIAMLNELYCKELVTWYNFPNHPQQLLCSSSARFTTFKPKRLKQEIDTSSSMHHDPRYNTVQSCQIWSIVLTCQRFNLWQVCAMLGTMQVSVCLY